MPGPSYVPAPSPPAPVSPAEPSGVAWVSRFPGSRSLDDLEPPFRDNCRRFVAALQAAGASVTISSTVRPAERAYLMRSAYDVSRGLSPASVPPHPGVNIRWVHTDGAGNVALAASRAAAQEMVSAYQLRYQPSLTSNHIRKRAVDMTISWTGNLAIRDGNGRLVTITSTPRTGADNTALHAVGASFGVKKLVVDPPHWSDDGG